MKGRLVSPSLQWKSAYLDFYEEWLQTGEAMVPWVIGKDPTHFEEMILSLEKSAEGLELPKGWVPDSTFWFLNEEERMVGAVNIRHDLTELLFNAGGHIGYGIRPSERRKGYATALLEQSLQMAKDLGVTEALVVCDRSNIGSMKTIIHNGGREDNDFIEEDGNVVKRFWIST
ncbi:GNAT family N-acetyltransferase [Halobacillus salinus]|uniref:GNAT family N-acetyltransferase n=1 Tax=Halobacillus salinus TaxID=192814 RepID=UPI0009A7B2B5|nr:GNAT family N-acetyltransferase [Halobacillus salinus]